MKAIIFLLLIPVLGISQDKLNDLQYYHNGDELITVYFSAESIQWSVIELWADNDLLLSHKPKTGMSGAFSFAKGEIPKGTKIITVYVTRLRNRVLFRDSIDIKLKRRPQVVLRVPTAKK